MQAPNYPYDQQVVERDSRIQSGFESVLEHPIVLVRPRFGLVCNDANAFGPASTIVCNGAVCTIN
eukprot:6065139-Amphidinium_carterae.2